MTLIFLWVIPWSSQLFMAMYCLAHGELLSQASPSFSLVSQQMDSGSLATAVITWRNSLVFHDHDKMVSLFIHVYPPLVLTVIRHFYPDNGERFPAVRKLPTLQPVQALFWSALFCKSRLPSQKNHCFSSYGLHAQTYCGKGSTGVSSLFDAEKKLSPVYARPRFRTCCMISTGRSARCCVPLIRIEPSCTS